MVGLFGLRCIRKPRLDLDAPEYPMTYGHMAIVYLFSQFLLAQRLWKVREILCLGVNLDKIRDGHGAGPMRLRLIPIFFT